MRARVLRRRVAPRGGHAPPTESAKDVWTATAGRELSPPCAPEEVTDETRLTVARSYLFECFANRRKPKADIYFCGLGHVSFFTNQPRDVVLRVRTAGGIVHGVRHPLRPHDMKVFPTWPRVEHRDSRAPSLQAPRSNQVGTVLELTAEPVDLTKPPIEEIVPLSPAPLVELPLASSMPFDELMAELRQQGIIQDSP